MMVVMRGIVLGTALMMTVPAGAQTSLFDQKPVGGTAPAAPAPAAAPVVAAKPKPKPKPKGPVPARMLTISNVSGSALTGFVVEAEGKQAKLAADLGNGQSTTLKLPVFGTCMVTISAMFERAGEAEQMEQDICKDRKVRLTNTGGES